MWASNGSFGGEVEQPYQNKFGGSHPLPSIPSSQTPQPSFDNALVPVGGRRSQLSQLSQIPNGGGQFTNGDYHTGRIQQMENRLGVAEQSNRALLEEVVRLQGELKQTYRTTEDTLLAERQARQQLTENIRASNDLIGQLGARLKRAEERVSDERTAVGALVNHTKQVEQAVLGSQQEILAKRDQQMTRYSELKNELDEANRMREQLERVTTSLVDDVRQVKGRTDTSTVEIGSLVHDVKERTKRLEEDNRSLMDHQRKFNENQQHSNQTTAVLRSQLDARLGEVRDVLMDLRNRVTTEETERRQQEQNNLIKMNDVQAQLHEVSRKRDESMHALDVVQREREHAADNERLKMHGKIAEIAEEVSKKILSKEIRLREEAQQKFGNIEKYLHAEQAARIAHEQAMREENEKRWAALQKLTEEEVLHVREGQKLDRHKNVGGMNKVSDTVEKMERQSAETRKQLEQVMKAEIKTRQSQDKQIESKIEDVQEKLGVAISTLQQAIGGINDQVSSTSNVSQDKMVSALEEAKNGQLRAVTDLDARLATLQSKMAVQEETLEDRILAAVEEALGDQGAKAANQIVEDHSENLEKINDWQDTADKKLVHVKERMDELGPEIREMNRTNETLQEDMKGLVDTEAKDRIRDVQMVRADLATKYTQLQQQIEAAAQKAAQGGGAPAAAPIPISQKEKLAAGKGGGKVDPAALEKMEFLEEELNKQRKKVEEVKETVAKVESSVQTVRVHLTRKVDTETKSNKERMDKMDGRVAALEGKSGGASAVPPAAASVAPEGDGDEQSGDGPGKASGAKSRRRSVAPSERRSRQQGSKSVDEGADDGGQRDGSVDRNEAAPSQATGRTTRGRGRGRGRGGSKASSRAGKTPRDEGDDNASQAQGGRVSQQLSDHPSLQSETLTIAKTQDGS